MQVRLTINERVEIDGRRATVISVKPTHAILRFRDGSQERVSTFALLEKVSRGLLKVGLPADDDLAAALIERRRAAFAALPPKRGSKEEWRREVLRRLVEELGPPPYSDGALRDFADKLKSESDKPILLSRATLRVWLRRDKEGKLAPDSLEDRGKRLEIEVEDIIEDAVEEFFLVQAPMSGDAIIRTINMVIDEENKKAKQTYGAAAALLEYPSAATVYRRLEEVDEDKRIAAQLGSHTANMMFGVFGAAPIETIATRVVEIDHTRIDLEVVDADGVNLGRPTLSLAIDRCTRMVLGFYIGWEPPSGVALMLLLRHIIAPKPSMAGLFNGFVHHEWTTWGLPWTFVIDNGLEFHAEQFKQACKLLGLADPEFAARKHAHWKGKIERLFRKTNAILLHNLPGTTLSTYNRDSEYRPRKEAALELVQLNALLHKYFVDIYPYRWHRGLKARPIDAWKAAIERHPPRLPPHLDQLDLLTCPAIEKPIHAYGIELEGLKYIDRDFKLMRVAAKGTVRKTVRYDPSDMTKIFVIDEDRREVVDAVCTDQTMHGKTLWQVRAINRIHLEAKKAAQREVEPRERELLTRLGAPQALARRVNQRKAANVARTVAPAVTPPVLATLPALALNDAQTFASLARTPALPPVETDYNLPPLDEVAAPGVPEQLAETHRPDLGLLPSPSGPDLDPAFDDLDAYASRIHLQTEDGDDE